MRATSCFLTLAAAIFVVVPAAAQTPARRLIRVEDLYRMRTVRDPQRSPEGRWVAFTVSQPDSARDANDTDVWMVSWDGEHTLPIATTKESESAPRFSPDGRWLAFLSARRDAKAAQVWLLNRLGGEAVKLTDFKGGVEDYAWSPDGTRLALIVKDPEEGADSTAKGDGEKQAPPPIVIDRYHFKSDADGYLGNRRSHLYVFDVEAKTSQLLTPGTFDEEQPAWSPDGRRIAFVSDRSADPDRSNDSNVFVVETRAGAPVRQLTRFPGPDGSPAWSPDGRTIAYLQGGAPQHSAYNLDRLAVIPAAGGEARVLTESLDRDLSSPAWTADGRAVLVTVTDDRRRPLARVEVSSGRVTNVTDGEGVVNGFSLGRDGGLALLSASDDRPAEVFAYERGRLRPISHQNDPWLAELRLGTTEEFSARAPDGNEVHGLLIRPADYVEGRRYPTLLRIHGGPNSQEQHEFHFERQLFAANGYVVVAANYRGSAGRGEGYQTAIYGDWGNLEVVDLLASIDHAVESGLADPERLGIGGWSYGGILTDYTIATTPRFKGAISGAGSALQLSMYGSDQYVLQYDTEIGPPWKNPDAWVRISYPFFHADRIRTPTLFLGGQNDFNVPIIGGEQMYQALRSLGVPTQLVVYPGQHHGIARPSYRVDLYRRYLDWYERWVKSDAGTTMTDDRRPTSNRIPAQED
jgi:dipeptidyl aminopeptidase/acylaminoacyl peptidase